jgi:hypothetical protein
MINLTQSILKDIAEELEMGMRAFIHKETHKLIYVPDENKFDAIDFEPWEEDLEHLEEYIHEYFEIEKWSSHEGYNMMLEFAEQLESDNPLQDQLIEALNKKKPFREFNFIIHDSGDFREEWFAFKSTWQQNYVERQLKDFFRTE